MKVTKNTCITHDPYIETTYVDITELTKEEFESIEGVKVTDCYGGRKCKELETTEENKKLLQEKLNIPEWKLIPTPDEIVVDGYRLFFESQENK